MKPIEGKIVVKIVFRIVNKRATQKVYVNRSTETLKMVGMTYTKNFKRHEYQQAKSRNLPRTT